jgi:hypothetical protein
MPGCVLHVSGERFDVDQFVASSSLKPYRVHHLGEPTVRRRSGELHDDSGFSVDVSEAEGDLSAEIPDAIAFLQRHEAELARLATIPEITDCRLDFGYYRRDVFMQSEYLPAELLRLAGAHGIAIELSLYPEPDETSVTDPVA